MIRITRILPESQSQDGNQRVVVGVNHPIPRDLGTGLEFADTANAMGRLTASFGMFSGAWVAPKGPGQISPGKSAAPPRVVVAIVP